MAITQLRPQTATGQTYSSFERGAGNPRDIGTITQLFAGAVLGQRYGDFERSSAEQEAQYLPSGGSTGGYAHRLRRARQLLRRQQQLEAKKAVLVEARAPEKQVSALSGRIAQLERELEALQVQDEYLDTEVGAAADEYIAQNTEALRYELMMQGYEEEELALILMLIL